MLDGTGRLCACARRHAWGRQGWTTATLAALDGEELQRALETAWKHALPAARKRRKPA